jgi:hypothetical protein
MMKPKKNSHHTIFLLTTLRYSDPDGQNPILGAVVGAAIGGVVEIGSQFLSGKGIEEIDLADVGVEMVKGAIAGSGVGALGIVLTDVVGAAVKASVDVNANIIDGKIVSTTKIVGTTSDNKNVSEALYDFTSDLAVGMAAGALAKPVNNALGRVAEKAAGKAQVFARAANDAAKHATSSTSQLQAKASSNAAKAYTQKASTENTKKVLLIQ